MNGYTQPALDKDRVQSVVVSAALASDIACLIALPGLVSSLDEPYRTVAAILVERHRQGKYTDRNVLAGALAQRPLRRCRPDGRTQELTADQVLALLPETAPAPGQAEAYLEVLQQDRERRRQEELQARMSEAWTRHSNNPEQLLKAIEQIAADARGSQAPGIDRYPSELLEIIPYAAELEERQRGCEFLGLDSGFQHINNLCNGLDTGLFVLAARPGEGKTTLVWQMCYQAAKLNQVPVIFVSMEQSKQELRAKALARLADVEYRHLLRGRLQATDTEVMSKVYQAFDEYAGISQYLTIVEADEMTTLKALEEIVVGKMRQRGAKRCLVAVDYMQILPLSAEEADLVKTPKDKLDRHVSGLRRLARDLNASVIGISSENRAGYDSKTLDVFKESGGIEYSADIAAILTHDKKGSTPADGEYRVEDLHIVKNRNGERGVVRFKFDAPRAKFVETERRDFTEEVGE
jgi:replicative DNA helicase